MASHLQMQPHNMTVSSDPPAYERLPLPASSTGELSFMEWYPPGNGTLSYPDENGDAVLIPGVSPFMIEERCPLLAHAFEDARSGPQLHLESLTCLSARAFLRYLYTSTYALSPPAGEFYEDVPTSALLHCQLFRLGDIYNLPDLKTQAYVNLLRQCEFGCSSPDKPIDLCGAIRYIYDHLRDHVAPSPKEAVLNYCVSQFLCHRLGEDDGMKQLAFDLRPFHQDLCRESMNRGFENETAAAIIQMPFKSYAPETYASREDVTSDRVQDFIYHFHANDEFDEAAKKRKRADITAPCVKTSDIALALRTRREHKMAVTEAPANHVQHERSSAAGNDSAWDSWDDVQVDRTEIPSQPVKFESPGSGSHMDVEYEFVPRQARTEELGWESDSDSSALVIVDQFETASSLRERLLPI